MAASDYAAARDVDFSDIPVIDVSGLATPEGLERVGEEIHRAARNVGFFYLGNHGIDEGLRKRAFAAAEGFFSLDETAKQSVAVDRTQRGWMAAGMTRFADARTHDLKEVFFWGWDVASDHPGVVAGLPLMAVNKWPDDVYPALKRDLLPYYHAVCDLGRRVLAAIAPGFGKPADFFAPYYRTPLARGQLVYYPPSDAAHESEQRFGAGPHTDFGALTLLAQDDNGGLQVRNLAGDWIAAPPVPNTFVCNIGDLMQRWTAGQFRSTVHRVINRSGRKRFSIPVFFDPQSEAVVDPRELVGEEGEGPVRAGDHIAGRNRATFSQYKD